MRKVRLLLFLAVVFITTFAAQAQNTPTRFQKQHLKQTVTGLVKALNTTETPLMQRQAVQTIRKLEWLFPNEDFVEFVAPLMKLITDENGDTQTRMLAAMALDGLHSDEGDNTIVRMSKTSSNKSIQELCMALAININTEL